MHYNRVRKEGRQGAKCSCSGNSHSKAKESGQKVLSTKQFSTSSNYPMEIRWSNKKEDGGRVRILVTPSSLRRNTISTSLLVRLLST